MIDENRNERFHEWVADHGAILQHVVNGFAAGHDRRDLMQEILLALWKAATAFRGEAKPSTFVYRVAHNTALTWRRSLVGYRKKLDEFSDVPSAPILQDADHSTARRLELAYAAIRRLPPLDRSLMLLALDGVSYREMAAIHGLSESNVGARLSRARQKLSVLLKGKEDED